MERKTTLERHIQTGLQALVLAVVIWIGNTVVALRDSSAILTTQITELKQQVNTMNGRFGEYMPRRETESRFEAHDMKHADIDRRLDSLEKKVN